VKNQVAFGDIKNKKLTMINGEFLILDYWVSSLIHPTNSAQGLQQFLLLSS